MSAIHDKAMIHVKAITEMLQASPWEFSLAAKSMVHKTTRKTMPGVHRIMKRVWNVTKPDAKSAEFAPKVTGRKRKAKEKGPTKLDLGEFDHLDVGVAAEQFLYEEWRTTAAHYQPPMTPSTHSVPKKALATGMKEALRKFCRTFPSFALWYQVPLGSETLGFATPADFVRFDYTDTDGFILELVEFKCNTNYKLAEAGYPFEQPDSPISFYAAPFNNLKQNRATTAYLQCVLGMLCLRDLVKAYTRFHSITLRCSVVALFPDMTRKEFEAGHIEYQVRKYDLLPAHPFMRYIREIYEKTEQAVRFHKR